ncbi:MAG: NUDIX hydrolase [Actinomycetota bacterium]|nr:NUDIX hydrolase [Actinomycetota bacterium]
MQSESRDVPPEPQPAATVVVARPGRGGVEVLVLRRAAGSRFAPGFVVFPGGVVDPRDGDLAARWFGDRSEEFRACAVRELAEEAGLVATSTGLRPMVPGEDPLVAISQAPPSVEALPEMARWVAPAFLSVRFDARFFAVAAPAGTVARPDGVEIDHAEWARPAAVLEGHRLYESIMWPTYRTLQRLAGCASVEEVLALRVEQEPPPMPGRARSPEWTELEVPEGSANRGSDGAGRPGTDQGAEASA